jgi:predicted GNAT family acetyltransferase
MAKIARRTSDRFEIEQDGQTSYLAYEADGQGWLSLLYTEVAEPLRGRGIAKDLAQMAFEYACGLSGSPSFCP